MVDHVVDEVLTVSKTLPLSLQTFDFLLALVCCAELFGIKREVEEAARNLQKAIMYVRSEGVGLHRWVDAMPRVCGEIYAELGIKLIRMELCGGTYYVREGAEKEAEEGVSSGTLQGPFELVTEVAFTLPFEDVTPVQQALAFYAGLKPVETDGKVKWEQI